MFKQDLLSQISNLQSILTKKELTSLQISDNQQNQRNIKKLHILLSRKI